MAARRIVPIVLPQIDAASCTIELREKILRRIPLFNEIANHDLRMINRSFTDQGFRAGATIIREGEPGVRLFVVALGIVEVSRSTESGGSVVLDMLSSGEYFGTLAGFGPEHYEDTVVALSAVCALSIDTEAFRRILVDYPSVALRSVEVLSDRLHLAQEMVRQLSGYSAEERIAYVLLRLARKLGIPWRGGVLIQAPLKREHLASMAGVTTETTSRVVSRLQKAGTLTAGRGWIAVMDEPALRCLAPDYTA